MARPFKLEWSGKDDAAANARRELPRLAAQFFAVTRRALSGPVSPRRLHGLRLAAKKFRYTLEVFRPVYPAAFEERLEELKKLQDWLGNANDASASRRILGSATLRRYPKVREFLEKRAAGEAAAFIRYWKKTFDKKGQEAWWTDFLARKARAPR